MIPVRLELSNFLSYAGPVELDFTAFRVASLTGDNGAGKSALLDAITYAVWGCARGCEGGMNQDRLIRDGCDEMHVDFTFELQHDTYRVIRRRSLTKGGEVHFLVADGDRWRNRAEGTIRETDEQIEATLRMNYETFAASAFFVQGRTDDFLRMTPSGRREVFAQLLDLGTYERLADAARQKAKEAEVRRGEHASAVEKLADSREEHRAIAVEVTTTTDEAAHLRDLAAAAVERAAAARELAAEADKAEAILSSERGRLEAAEAALAELTATTEAKHATLDRIEALLGRAEEVEAAITEAAELRAADERARCDQRAAAELRERRTEVIGGIEAEKRALVAARDGLAEREQRLRTEVEALAVVAAELASIEEALADAGDPKAAVEELRAQIGEHEKSAARLDEQLRAADVRAEEIAERIRLVASGGGECPICGTPLDAAHRKKVKVTLQREAKDVTTERDGARAARDTVRKESKRCAEDLRRLQDAVRQHESLVATAGQLTSRIAASDGLREELRTVSVDLEATIARLRDDAFAEALRAEVAEIDAQLSSAYDEAAHAQITERLRKLQPFEALYGEITASVQQREGLLVEMERLRVRVVAAATDLDERRARVMSLEAEVATLSDARTACATAEAEAAEATAAAQTATQSVIALHERLEAAARRVADLDVAEAAERAAATQRRRYKRLTEAFGRNGIPQRIIENERPFLEDETNRILGRLSDEPMAVHFRFQGKTKAGKDRETLEILVRPHDGEPRDFAMFSGGEAFRIAFAVRLALSKLLMRRAGARLETLVIDEGFGTQDPEGRERVKQAINLARQEFSKIIVITHLDDLKDQFGTQIHVTKGAAGSELEFAAG